MTPSEAPPVELVVDAKTGRVRHAGATTDEGAWVMAVKDRAEKSLYTFAKAILGRAYLWAPLHKPVCDWLMHRPPQRKGLLLPRECAKTSIVSHALPLHILIQTPESNVYFPGEDGADQRIVLACESENRGKDHVRVQRDAWTKNELLRAFWPHRCWAKPKTEADKWNDSEYNIRRPNEYPDPSVRTIGVGGAITGAHPSVLIKDDLISLDAANSQTVMETAIQWNTAARALVNKPNCLEFMIGTRWAVFDLYSHVQETDDTVEWMIRSLVEDGEIIYPLTIVEVDGKTVVGGYTQEKITELQGTFRELFWLLYMNNPANPELADFSERDMRPYAIVEGSIEYDEDDRDLVITAAGGPRPPTAAQVAATQDRYGERVRVLDLGGKRGQYLRLRGDRPRRLG